MSFVHRPPKRTNHTSLARVTGMPWLGVREKEIWGYFSLAFWDLQESTAAFSGKRNIRHLEEIRKTSKGHACSITGRPRLGHQASLQLEKALCVSQKILDRPFGWQFWNSKQDVAREYLESPCQGAFHV